MCPCAIVILCYCSCCVILLLCSSDIKLVCCSVLCHLCLLCFCFHALVNHVLLYHFAIVTNLPTPFTPPSLTLSYSNFANNFAIFFCLIPLSLLACIPSSTYSLPMPPSHLVIIGGGIQGSSVAYYTSLLSPTTTITILEANSHLAPHASGKGGGFLARSWGDGTSTEALHHTSFDLHASLAKTWGLASYRNLPVLSVAGNGKKPFQEMPLKGVAAPNWLDGKGRGLSVMGEGSDTAQVTPLEFTTEAAARSGASVRLGCKVNDVVTREGVVSGVTLEGGEGEASRERSQYKRSE